jgi:hypothetical protein
MTEAFAAPTATTIFIRAAVKILCDSIVRVKAKFPCRYFINKKYVQEDSTKLHEHLC